MTDAHCHVSAGDPSVRELLVGRDFLGVHPWASEQTEQESTLARLRDELLEKSGVGVGEIGLDRLKDKCISSRMRTPFERQLDLAAELQRPVTLHGAKCWGQVVSAVALRCGRVPTFLCHGFSRSNGLLPDIERLGGFVSVGPAVLNDHAVNYRELVKNIPERCLLVETDRTEENAAVCPSLREVLFKVAELRGVSMAKLEALTDVNADRFFTRGV